MSVASDVKNIKDLKQIVEIDWQKKFVVEYDGDEVFRRIAINNEIAERAFFYCIYGQHPIFGQDSLMYIGETKRGSKGTREVNQRLREHFNGRFWDHTDLTVTVGTCEQSLDDETIRAVESILIAANKPVMNKKFLDAASPNAKGILIFNYGYVRSLATESSGLYWCE